MDINIVMETIIQYGLVGVVIGWFMWRDISVIRELQKSLSDFSETMSRLDYALVKQNNLHDECNGH